MKYSLSPLNHASNRLTWAFLVLLAAAEPGRADDNVPVGDTVRLGQLDVVANPLSASPADSAATKLPNTLHETPRSVTVVDEDRIREQDFHALKDTFEYVPGVFANADNNDSYHFFSRGFDMGPDDTKLDGFTGFLVNGSFTPSLFGVQQVVFLRGPDSLLYGASSLPGGMIELVSKRPEPSPFARLDVRYAGYDGMSATAGSSASEETDLDVNQLLTADGSVAYRAAAEAANNGFYNRGIFDRERAALFALTWKFGRDGRYTLTPTFLYERSPFGAGRGLVISPSTSLSAADGRSGPIHTGDLTPITDNLSAGSRRLTRHIAGFDFGAVLAPQWHASLSYRFMGIDSDSNQFTPQAATLVQTNPADPRSWVISRRQTESQMDRRNQDFDAETIYETDPAAGIKNLTQLGFNGRFYDLGASRSAVTQPNQSPINIYTGQALTPLVDPNPPLVDTFLNHDFYWNAFVQNQTELSDRWVLTLSAGYGEQHFGRIYPATLAPPANLSSLVGNAPGKLTPNAGLVYNAARDLSFYVSYATSYQPAPSSDEDANGQTGGFQPTTGSSYETGAKLDLPNRRAAVAIAFFGTEVENVLIQSAAGVLDPDGNQFYSQPGAGRRTYGSEFSAELRPSPGWQLRASASYLDSHYYGAGTLSGSRTEKSPPLACSIFGRYDFPRGPLAGLGASLDVVWQGERLSAAQTAAAPDPLMLPGYAKIDAGLFYRWGAHWDFGVHCENARDELYFVTGSTGSTLEIGAPREFAFTAGYRF